MLSTSLPRLQDVALDGRVLAFTLGVSVLTAFVFGPLVGAGARRAARHDAGRNRGRRGHHRRAGHDASDDNAPLSDGAARSMDLRRGAAGLASVALLACYLPARRAARAEPMVALRTE